MDYYLFQWIAYAKYLYDSLMLSMKKSKSELLKNTLKMFCVRFNNSLFDENVIFFISYIFFKEIQPRATVA